MQLQSSIVPRGTAQEYATPFLQTDAGMQIRVLCFPRYQQIEEVDYKLYSLYFYAQVA